MSWVTKMDLVVAIGILVGILSIIYVVLSVKPKKKWRLTVDGEVKLYYTRQEARDAAPGINDDYTRWSIDELVATRWFNVAFGYKGGTTSTQDLSDMGVPINYKSLSDKKL